VEFDKTSKDNTTKLMGHVEAFVLSKGLVMDSKPHENKTLISKKSSKAIRMWSKEENGKARWSIWLSS
jgi:hypothetical protein